MPSYSRTYKAFTLLEVLIVIAIMILLATLGFQVGSQVRERVRRTTCISNLRQIGQALVMYRADYERHDSLYFLPPGVWYLVPIYVKDKRIFRCPNDPNDFEPLPKPYFHNSYLYRYHIAPLPPDLADRAWWIQYPRRRDDYPIMLDGNHFISRKVGMPWLVLRLDGRVEIVNKEVTTSGSDL